LPSIVQMAGAAVSQISGQVPERKHGHITGPSRRLRKYALTDVGVPALNMPEQSEKLPQKANKMFEALKLETFRWLWLGSLCSFFATQMQQIAQAWLAYEITHSALNLGVVTLAFGFPYLVISIFSGVIIDRYPKRNIIITSQFIMALSTLVIAALVSTGMIQFWHLVAASAVSGVSAAFNMPGRQAVIQELVSRDRVFNAIALTNSGNNLARVAGPALGGALIGFVSTAGVYYCASGFFLIAIISMAKLPVTKSSITRPVKEMLADMLSGFMYIRGNRNIYMLMIMEFFLSIFGMTFSSIMPVFAEIFKLQAVGYGFLLTMLGLGTLTGSLSMAALSHFKKKGKLLLISGVTFGLLLILFGNIANLTAWVNLNNLNFGLALGLLFLLGAISQAYTVTSSTTVQLATESKYLGRVLSAWFMVIGIWPFGCFLLGAEAQAWGAPAAITIGGSALTLFMLIIALSSRRIRNLE
jgi:MFS family permease